MPCEPNMKRSFQSVRLMFFVLLVLAAPFESAWAEGSWQMGLNQGASFRQPLYETSTAANRSVLRVDILNPGEVINIFACGTANGNELLFRIFDPNGNRVLNSRTDANVDCNDNFNTTFDPADAQQHVTTMTGVYVINLYNLNGTRFDRFDVTVTNDVNDRIDPRENGGRLWSDHWYFWTGSFGEEVATDADLFVVADGVFTGTFVVWKLDLNKFSGFGYGLKANKLGVTSPNAAGDVVAGLSVPTSGNAVEEQYPIYLSYPERNFPATDREFTVSELVFLDSDNIDNAISSNGNGVFYFTTDFDDIGVYQIVIDTGSPAGNGPDGVYGQGDVFLRGEAISGDNVIAWDGRDNNGDVLPFGAYTAELSVRSGEFHFAADDVETSGGPGEVGLKMYRAIQNGIDTPTTLYWDEFTVLGSTEPSAFNQTGIYDGDHNWGAFNSGGIGNIAFIDTYTFSTSATPDPAPVAVVPEDLPLVSIVKSFSPETITQGGVSTMQFELSNNGITTLTGITVSDAMPLEMTLHSLPVVTGDGCSGFSFDVDTVIGGDQLNIIDGTMNGDSDCVVTADVTATVAGTLVNTTSAVISNELPFGEPSNDASLIVEMAEAVTLVGTVFEDNGLAATAHDGLQGGSELPIAGVVVELRDTAGTLLDSVITNTDGGYELAVPTEVFGSDLQVVTVSNFNSVSENVNTGSAGDVTDGIIQFTADPGFSGSYRFDFGKIKPPHWLSNSVAENSPDTVVFHSHQFQSHSSGDLDIAYTSLLDAPVGSDRFSAVLYRDDNCNGALDSGEAALSVTIAVTAGMQVCVINKVSIAANAVNANTYTTGISATLTYTDSIGSGHGLTDFLELTDVTRVVASGQGVLQLSKTVQNVTQAAAITTRNTAAPDDVLRYAIDFSNNGTGSISEVLLTDSTPAFSTLAQPVQCPVALPDGIVACEIVFPNATGNMPGYTGPVHWQFSGELIAGAGGQVWFEIKVE